MDYTALTQGGYRFLGEEAVSGFGTAKAPFLNAPGSDTLLIQFDVYGSDLTFTFGGATPVAGSVGHDYDVGTYTAIMPPALAKKAKAVGSGTLWVTYWSRG